MASKKRTAKREKQRLRRKAQMAENQAQQFEDELSSHELNIERLEAIPESERDDSWEQAKTTAEKAITSLDSAIETSLTRADELRAEVGDEEKPKS